MGVGSRRFQTFLCDACGREIIAEENAQVTGYYIGVLHVVDGSQRSSDNVFACSAICVDRAVHDALNRQTLSKEEKVAALEDLWKRGRAFLPNSLLPVYDAGDGTRMIGTVEEIANHKEPPPPRLPTPNRRPPDALG